VIFWLLLALIVLVPVGVLIDSRRAEKRYLKRGSSWRAQVDAAHNRHDRASRHGAFNSTDYTEYKEYYSDSRNSPNYGINRPEPWFRMWSAFGITAGVFVIYTIVMSIVFINPQAGTYKSLEYKSELVPIDIDGEAKYLVQSFSDEEPWLAWLRDTGDGIEPRSSAASYWDITYTEDTPYVAKYDYVNTIPLLLPWSVDCAQDYDMHVPKGSIYTEFVVLDPFIEE
jgi:hypothetical protein